MYLKYSEKSVVNSWKDETEAPIYYTFVFKYLIKKWLPLALFIWSIFKRSSDTNLLGLNIPRRFFLQQLELRAVVYLIHQALVNDKNDNFVMSGYKVYFFIQLSITVNMKYIQFYHSVNDVIISFRFSSQ